MRDLKVLEVEPITDEVIDMSLSEVNKIVKETLAVVVEKVLRVPYKCRGYQVSVVDIYSMIACQGFEELNVVIENCNLHDRTCTDSDYQTQNGNIVKTSVKTSVTDHLLMQSLKEGINQSMMNR